MGNITVIIARMTLSTRKDARARFLLALVLLGLLSLAAPPAQAVMGDCGQPTNASSIDRPVTSDALATLKAAVGSVPCVAEVCDVAGSSGVTAADALEILKKAVGLPVTLTCPSCPSTVCTPCTEAAIKARIDAINETGMTGASPLLTPSTSTIFACKGTETSPVVINLSEDWGSPVLTAPGAIFAADDRFIVFALSPLCYNRCLGTCSNDPTRDCTKTDECGGMGTCSIPSVTACTLNSQCSTNRCSATNCPNIDSNAERFLKLNGANQTVRGFTVRGFFEGVHFNATNGTIDEVTFDRQCDDSISNESAGVGGEVRNSVLMKGCDKCAQDAAGPAIDPATCTGRSCYHVAYYDTNFEGCAKPLRLANTAAGGRFLISGGTQKPISGWPCNGSDFGAVGLETTVDNITVEGCKSGFEFGGGTHTLQGESRITKGIQRGVLAKGTGTTTVKYTEITNNGGQGSSTPVGGAVVMDSADLRLGNSSTTGHNCISGNKSGAGTGRELANHRANYQLKAQYNWWGGPPPTDEFFPGAPGATFDSTNYLGAKPAFCQ